LRDRAINRPVLALRNALLTLTCAVMLSACARQMEDVRGVESYIRKIELEGVNRFKKKELLSYLNMGESSRLIWKPRYVFSEAMLPIDAERILELYRAYGYYDAEVVSMVPDTKVGPHPPVRQAQGRAQAGQDADQDRRPRGRADQGHRPRAALARGRARRSARQARDRGRDRRSSLLKEGEAFEIPKLNTSTQLLKGHMQDRGYAFAQVKEKAVVDPRPRRRGRLRAAPGPFVKIGEITIEGLVGVPEKYVRNEIDFAPGKRYSPALLTRIEQKIYGMDVFQSVSIDAEDKPTATARST
jgi:outer membrane protein assembly factor BamA